MDVTKTDLPYIPDDPYFYGFIPGSAGMPVYLAKIQTPSSKEAGGEESYLQFGSSAIQRKLESNMDFRGPTIAATFRDKDNIDRARWFAAGEETPYLTQCQRMWLKCVGCVESLCPQCCKIPGCRMCADCCTGCCACDDLKACFMNQCGWCTDPLNVKCQCEFCCKCKCCNCSFCCKCTSCCSSCPCCSCCGDKPKTPPMSFYLRLCNGSGFKDGDRAAAEVPKWAKTEPLPTDALAGLVDGDKTGISKALMNKAGVKDLDELGKMTV